jgi:hypothetical protein
MQAVFQRRLLDSQSEAIESKGLAASAAMDCTVKSKNLNLRIKKDTEYERNLFPDSHETDAAAGPGKDG